MEKKCETCARAAACRHSGNVCRNYREAAERHRITPEEYAAQTGGRVEWRTARESFDNADGTKTVVEHRYPVVIGEKTVCGVYHALNRDEVMYAENPSENWYGTAEAVDEYTAHDGGITPLLRALGEED